MKILCVCERGNSRSVALAYIFKDMLNQDAIAMGIHVAREKTKELLYTWADIVILVDKSFEDEVPKEYQDKLKIWDVGADRYFLGFHPELLEKFEGFINKEVTVIGA